MIEENELQSATRRMHEVMCGCFKDHCPHMELYEEACIAVLGGFKPSQAYEHHASFVIMDLSHMCYRAARENDEGNARKYSRIAFELENEFPKAKKELEERFPKRLSINES